MNSWKSELSSCGRYNNVTFLSDFIITVPVRYSVGQLLGINTKIGIISFGAVDKWTKEKIVLIRYPSKYLENVLFRIGLQKVVEGVQKIDIIYHSDEALLLSSHYYHSTVLRLIQTRHEILSDEFLLMIVTQTMTILHNVTKTGVRHNNLTADHIMVDGGGNISIRGWRDNIKTIKPKESIDYKKILRNVLTRYLCGEKIDLILSKCDCRMTLTVPLTIPIPTVSDLFPSSQCEVITFCSVIFSNHKQGFYNSFIGYTLRLICAFWCRNAVLPPPTAIQKPSSNQHRSISYTPREWIIKRSVGCGVFGDGDGEELFSSAELKELSNGFSCCSDFVNSETTMTSNNKLVGYQQRGRRSDGTFSEIIEFDGFSVLSAPREVQNSYSMFVRSAQKILNKFGYQKLSIDKGSVLRLTRYHGGVTTEGGVLSCPAHADMSLLTLASGDSKGFQIFNKSDNCWEYLSEESSVIVFPGKVLTMMSNGESLPTLHRVVLPSSECRTSITFFCRLNPEEVVTDFKDDSLMKAFHLHYTLNTLPYHWSTVVDGYQEMSKEITSFYTKSG